MCFFVVFIRAFVRLVGLRLYVFGCSVVRLFVSLGVCLFGWLVLLCLFGWLFGVCVCAGVFVCVCLVVVWLRV